MTLPVQSRPLALAGPAAVAGVALQAAPWPYGAACFGALLALMAARPSRTLLLLTLLLTAALGAGWVAGHRSQEAAGRVWPRAPPRAATCDLEVAECWEDPFAKRAWIKGLRKDGMGVLCSWPGNLPDDVAPGARVRIAARCYLPRPATNPGQRDPRKNLAQRGIVLMADLKVGANLKIEQPAPPGPRRALSRMRRRAARRLVELLPPDIAPLATALLLGIRTGIEASDRLRFERTGTMHLLAISGMHVLLLAGMIHRLLRWAGLGPRAAAGFTLALALAYVPLTGAAPPIRRAVTVLCFFALALVRGRPPDAASALGGAALVLALHDPADIFRVGFQLSFAAAVGIVLLAPAWREAWGRRQRLLARFPAVRADRPVRLWIAGYLVGSLPVSLAAWCATQGLVAHAFGLVTPLAPLVNLIAAPFVALALPLLALLALGVAPCSSLVTLTLRGLRALLEQAAHLPAGHALVPAVPVLAVLLWCAGCLLLRWGPRVGIACLVCAVLLSCRPPVARGPELVLFDVGHGQAALLRFDDESAVLVDAGSRGRRRIARRVLLPGLRALGIRRLEAVVCTHEDADHWSALPDLLELFSVGAVVVGERAPPQLLRTAMRTGTRLVRAKSGDVIHRAGRTSLSVLADGRGARSSNERSLALLFEVGPHRVLLPADREERGLERLIRGGLPTCDVLVAPHHGARCRTARALGAAVRPSWLLVSGTANFADAPTLRAYGATRTLQTIRHGCITVRFLKDGTMQVRGFLR